MLLCVAVYLCVNVCVCMPVDMCLCVCPCILLHKHLLQQTIMNTVMHLSETVTLYCIDEPVRGQ